MTEKDKLAAVGKLRKLMANMDGNGLHSFFASLPDDESGLCITKMLRNPEELDVMYSLMADVDDGFRQVMIAVKRANSSQDN